MCLFVISLDDLLVRLSGRKQLYWKFGCNYFLLGLKVCAHCVLIWINFNLRFNNALFLRLYFQTCYDCGFMHRRDFGRQSESMWCNYRNFVLFCFARFCEICQQTFIIRDSVILFNWIMLNCDPQHALKDIIRKRHLQSTQHILSIDHLKICLEEYFTKSRCVL